MYTKVGISLMREDFSKEKKNAPRNFKSSSSAMLVFSGFPN